MTYTTDDITKRSLEGFQRFDADTQLALLWYGYEDIKEQLTPGTQPLEDAGAIALYDQITALSQPEQLQAQRDIVSCASSPISQTYSSLNSSGKLFVWLQLAQGIEEGKIIPVPSDYQLPGETDEFVNSITQLNFEQRLNFMRSAVVAMGAHPQR
jgi:Orange carotenoid protein, N-terminal